MSIKSYKENVAKRVAGPSLPVCFPAALEQISPYHKYKPQVYKDYKAFINWFDQFSREERSQLIHEQEDMITNLVKPLGGLSCNDVIFSRATTPLGFMRVVRSLLEQDLRVSVDIKISGYDVNKTVHAVGLIPTPEKDHVMLVSTHVPKPLQGIVPLQKVAPRVAVSNDVRVAGHPLNTANIIAFPHN